MKKIIIHDALSYSVPAVKFREGLLVEIIAYAIRLTSDLISWMKLIKRAFICIFVMVVMYLVGMMDEKFDIWRKTKRNEKGGERAGLFNLDFENEEENKEKNTGESFEVRRIDRDTKSAVI